MSDISDSIKIMVAFNRHQVRAMESGEGGHRCVDHPAYFLKAFRGTGGRVKFMCPSCFREHDIDVEAPAP